MKRSWIKLYIEILDDPKMGRLSNHLWRRAIELFLLAGRNGNDGLLQPVEEMAWVLRSSPDEIAKTLMSLAEIGVVHETPQGWMVTHWKDRQYSESYERTMRYLERKRESNRQIDGEIDEEVDAGLAETSSPSTSPSDSVSLRGGGMGEGSNGASTAAAISAFGDNSIREAERLYQKITGQITFPPAWDEKHVGAIVDVLYGHFEHDTAKAEQSAKPVFERWCNTRGKNGRLYSRTGTGWLDWWLADLAPRPESKQESEAEKTRRMLAEKDEKVRKAVPRPDGLQKPVSIQQVAQKLAEQKGANR